MLIFFVTFRYGKQTLCKVNESVVRLGSVQGEYHWHKHDVEDEFFYVVSGRFIIEMEDRTSICVPARRSSCRKA